jgi:hypothetical protein
MSAVVLDDTALADAVTALVRHTAAVMVPLREDARARGGLVDWLEGEIPVEPGARDLLLEDPRILLRAADALQEAGWVGFAFSWAARSIPGGVEVGALLATVRARSSW